MRQQLTRHLLACPASSLTVRPSIQRRVPRLVQPLSTNAGSDKPPTASLNPRWLSEVKSRIGKCIMFGLNDTQTKEAGSILQEIALDWRGLLAGSEGFLTEKNRMGLYRQEVVWGEMVPHAPPLPHSVMKILGTQELITGRDAIGQHGHVNNVVYNRYAESARVNWTLIFANMIDPAHKREWSELLSPRSIGLILRSIRTDYKFPMTYPDRVTVLHKLRSEPQLDTDHFILDVLILSELHRRPAARCVEDIVVYNYKTATKAPLYPFMVEKFRETWAMQEQAKKIYGSKVTDLIRRTRELEKNSWDRPDAVEDLGSAAKS